MQKTIQNIRPRSYASRLYDNIRKHHELYLLILPAIAYYVIFHYIPMYGAQIAFRDFYPGMDVWESPWVGFDFFQRFFRSYRFIRLITNTLRLSLMSLILGSPMPILLALMLNEVRSRAFKKIVQTVSYAPHFISVVCISGMILLFFSQNGLFNSIRGVFGQEALSFMASPAYFPWIYVLSGVWQGMGFGSIIYMAALSSVDVELYEAARIDGASMIQKIRYIDLPSILPTFVILLILNCGSLLSVGWEKALMLQNVQNISASEIISTYVYQEGVRGAEFSYASAIGLFNSAVNLVMLTLVNAISRKVNETSLW